MEAIQFDSFGPPEVLQHRNLPDPRPGPGQVLIRVESASVNYSDTMRRRNLPYPIPTQPPFVPGSEVAGTVHGESVLIKGAGGAVGSFAIQLASLAPFGRLVSTGLASGEPGALTAQEQSTLFYAPAPGQSVHGFNIGAYFGVRPEVAGQALGELIGLVARGVLKAPVGMVLPLSDAGVAHRHLEERTSAGKIVLKPWP